MGKKKKGKKKKNTTPTRNIFALIDIYNATLDGNYNLVRNLLAHKIDLDYAPYEHGEVPLHVVSDKGHHSIVTMLLERKADVNE